MHPTLMPEPETLERLRPLLFSIAYKMTSSVSAAEDLVQDAFLRYEWAVREGAAVQSPRAYLAATVTRLAIDELRSARARREAYVGEWLPEPLLTEDVPDDPQSHAEQAESISMAFLLVLERLSPVERAAFLLHDVFGYDYAEIALVIGKGEANTRQIATRARRHVQSERPRFDASPEERERLAGRFFAALQEGDLTGLVAVLAADVVVYGDGGGKAPQWAAPIVGPERVARLFAGLGQQMREHGLRLERRSINGQPGVLVRDPDGRLTNVFCVDVSGGTVRAIRSVINPDKLRHLGRVADVRALARQGPARPGPH